MATNAFATSLNMPYCNTATGGFIYASQWNANCSAIQSYINNQNIDGTTNIAVGGVQTSNIANLAVTDGKIAGITTAGKVNGSAITAMNNIPSGAGVTPTVNLGSGTANSISFLRGDQTWNNPFAYYVKASETETSGTNGQTSLSGTATWITVVLNTKDSDPASIATLNSNQITLPAGTYICDIYTPIYRTTAAQTRLQNITASSTLLIGTSDESPNTTNQATVKSVIKGEFTLGVSSAIAIQVNVSNTTNAQIGYPSSIGTEVYTVATFQKVA